MQAAVWNDQSECQTAHICDYEKSSDAQSKSDSMEMVCFISHERVPLICHDRADVQIDASTGRPATGGRVKLQVRDPCASKANMHQQRQQKASPSSPIAILGNTGKRSYRPPIIL